MGAEVAEITYCDHCGSLCEDQPIHFDSKAFCCYGCQAVYELLQASDLHQYYASDELKTTRIQDRLASERKFGFLDLPEVERRLLRYQDDQVAMVRFYISGIHCSSCIYLLEHLPRLDSSILKSEVNFVRKEVSITYQRTAISLKAIAVLLSSVGYPPTIHLDSLDQSATKAGASSIGMKIAVAGFCFGNSMLISLPEYLDVGYQLEVGFKSLFGWINLLLALPVVFYAAQDYFISSWKGLRHGYLNIDVPISLGIITLFSRSLFEIVSEMGPGYMDSLTGLVFFLLIGKWYQGKTYQALSFDRDYTSYFPISVTRVDAEGTEELVMVGDLKAGDRIVLHSHELVPADGVIAEGEGRLDYSFVTGEAEPVSKQKGERVFAGGRQVGGQLTILLERAVNNSELTQLWNGQSFDKSSPPRYDGLIDKVGKYFTIAVILLALATGIYWGLADPGKVWNAVTAVLIVACPCALALAMPFGLGHGMRILGSKGLYLKNAQVIEQAGQIAHIVFDKTGTLTKNDPLDIGFVGSELTHAEKELVKSACASSAHPLSKLVSGHFGDGVRKLPISHYEEEIGKGILAEIASQQVRIGSADWAGAVGHDTPRESQVHLSIDGQYKGHYSIRATYRPGIFDHLKALRGTHSLHLLSGDNATEAPHLTAYFDALHFDQKPKEKLQYVHSIKGKTLMIGDGLNDAGALKAADVGIAVCEDIHQFSPACDGLLRAGSIGQIPSILRFSKVVMRVIMAALAISFAYNIVGLSFAVTANLTPVVSAILMPVSSVTVVGFITLTVNYFGARLFAQDQRSGMPYISGTQMSVGVNDLSFARPS